jgi:hypothetical protein
VASLAHPGGNATGSSNVAPDLSAKLLGTFAQLVPGMSSVGVVVNPPNPGAVAQMDGTQQAVHALEGGHRQNTNLMPQSRSQPILTGI